MSPNVRRLRDSYAAKLALAFVLVIALTVALGSYVLVQTSDAVQTDVQNDLTTMAEVRANELDTWLASVGREARTTARHPTVRGGDRAEIREHLSQTVADGRVPHGVSAIHYYDTESKEILTSSADGMIGVRPGEQGAPFATDPPTFSGPDDVYVTAPFSVPVVDFPVVAVMTPVAGADDRAIIYMVNSKAHTESLAASIEGGSTAVRTADGTVVSHPDPERIGTRGTDGGVQSLVESASSGSTAFGQSSDGETLLATAPMATTDWVVEVRAPASNAYAIRSTVTSNVVGLLLVAIISLALVGVTTGSNTVISLRQLSAKADRMADGELDVELDTTRTDEFGTLYASFADMRNSLRDQIREAEEARADAESAKAEAEEARADAEAAKADAERMNEHLEQKAAEYRSVMVDCADGDLTRRVDADSESDAMAAIGEAFNEMIGEIERTVATVTTFATHVADAAADVDDSADDAMVASSDVTDSIQSISAGATRQSENLQDVSEEMGNLSASAEEMAATVDEVAATSQRAADESEDGRAAAQAAISEMNAIETRTDETVDQIEQLESEMEAIGEIVEVITDIAEETNILALNASIEAARAENGSDGFAVVADEVKALAEETKESAAEIEGRIDRIQSRTAETVAGMQATSERIENGTDTVETAVESLERIVEHVEETNVSIQEINSVTEDQASSTQRIGNRLDEVAAISEDTTDEAETVAETAEQQTETLARVGDSASELAEQADELMDRLDDFSVQRDRLQSTAAVSEVVSDDD